MTSDSAHSWRLYNAASLEHQATMTCYPAIAILLSHYPDTEWTSPCPILIMPSARLGSEKIWILKSLLVWLDQHSNPRPTDSPISQDGRRALLLIRLPNSFACCTKGSTLHLFPFTTTERDISRTLLAICHFVLSTFPRKRHVLCQP